MLMKFRGMDLHIKQLSKIPEFLKKYDPVEYRRLSKDISDVGFILEDMDWPKVVDLLRTEETLEITTSMVIDKVFTIIQRNCDGCIENPYMGHCVNKIGFYHRMVGRKHASGDEPWMYEDKEPYTEAEAEAVLEKVLSELTDAREEYRNRKFDTVLC